MWYGAVMPDPVTIHQILPPGCFNEIAICRHGPMLYNRHDQYVGASLRKYGEFSPGESEVFRALLAPGMTVVEVGANVGAHTVELSRLVGPGGAVHAFEPQRIVFQTLCANLALNGCANVFAHHAAVGAVPGEIAVPFLPPDQPANFGGLSLLGSTWGESVPLRTLDTLGLAACHMVKLDLEGMEIEALQGGAGLVRRFRPTLYVENDRQERAGALIELLLSWRYRLYWHNPPLFTPNNFAGDAENIFGTLVSINMLAIPAERNITVQGLPEVTRAPAPAAPAR
jgi:FkbM family methyltransferase